MIYKLKRGDTGRTIQATLIDADTGEPADLTGGTVLCVMKHNLGTVRTGSCTVGSAGVVTYTFVALDTAVAGTLQIEFEFTSAGGLVTHFPSEGYERATIEPDLNP